MNIQDAKIEIKNTLRAYHLKDGEGNYRFPVVRQRPILLMGPPGIGKTAILRQIAEECGVGLVCYTLTHHTRQSAVGLPHIEKRCYGGEEMSVTEYTMSEIIADIYAYMEKTGRREGILFLDEVNCVSETLAPTMLELLQNKTFGSHKIPEGWILAAAGNPPQYNKSVREFDVATLDRVRTIDIQPDLQAFLAYAGKNQVHSAVCAYLSIHPEHFYLVEDQAEKMNFVTARGWEDLSELIKGYEALDIPVTAEVTGQYLQQEEIAKKFAAYYQLYRKYHEDYEIHSILSGKLSQDQRERKVQMARDGGFEERFTVVQLLADCLGGSLAKWHDRTVWLQALREALQRLKRDYNNGPGELAASMEKSLKVRLDAGIVKEEETAIQKWVIYQLEVMDLQLQKEHIHGAEEAFARIQELFLAYVEDVRDKGEQAGERLRQAFLFAEECFGDGQELMLLVTALTRDQTAMAYIAQFGSKEFLKYSDALMFESQEKDLMEQCRAIME